MNEEEHLPDSESEPPAREGLSGGAGYVALGILASRVIGLVRERVFAHYFGNSGAADAFRAAIRIPNVLQNLFGEGVLSASFIPVYSGLLGKGEKAAANEVAGVIFGALAVAVAVIVAFGVSFASSLVGLIAPGFSGDKRDLTIALTQIFFPGMGLLVMSAWCLGILNSHRRFFLSYAAPVFWNIVIIGTLVVAGGANDQDRLAVIAAWSVVGGSALQFLVQLPTVLKLTGKIRISLNIGLASVRTVIRNFFPVLIGRGIVQVSAYADSLLASLLPTGAVAALGYVQNIYLLPIGLFGMSVSAAELPAMSQVRGNDADVAEVLRKKLQSGLRQISYFIIPSAAVFIVLGDFVVQAVYQTGKFGTEDSLLVWKVLAAASLGLVPATLSRLYSSTFYALHDTRTPLRCSIIRVTCSVILGVFGALKLSGLLGVPPMWGLMGLTFASAVGALVEYRLLRRALFARIGRVTIATGFFARLWIAALAATMLSRMAILASNLHQRFLIGAIACGLAGFGYVGLTLVLKVPEARGALGRIRRKLGR
ncbi:MAG: murein biosynthesis integral membrane protein MurJ [Bdellovibrionota bacterium]